MTSSSSDATAVDPPPPMRRPSAIDARRRRGRHAIHRGNRATERLQAEGWSVAHAQLRHLNPLPANTEQVLRSYRKVLVPEVNMGHLALILRATYLIDVIGLNKVRGKSFRIVEIKQAAEELLK